MKRFAYYAFLVVLTLALLVVLWQFRTILVVFLVALALTAATRPLVESFDLRRINRGLASILVYVSLLAVIMVIFAGVGQALSDELSLLSTQIAMAYEGMYNNWPDGGTIQQAIADRLPPPEELYDITGGQPFVGAAVVALTTNLASFITEFVFVLILSIYWSIDRARFERLWLSLLPVDARTWARNTYREIENEIGSYIRSMFVRALMSGLLLGAGLALLGVPYPALLGILGGLLSLIPWLGVILVALPVAAAALTVGPQVTAAAIVFTIAILIALEALVIPRIISRRHYSSLLMILIAFMLAEAAGLLALVLAPPLAATIQLVFRRTRETPPAMLSMGSIRRIADLRERVSRVRAMIEGTEMETPAHTNSMIQRLEKLVNEAEELLPVDGDGTGQVAVK